MCGIALLSACHSNAHSVVCIKAEIWGEARDVTPLFSFFKLGFEPYTCYKGL